MIVVNFTYTTADGVEHTHTASITKVHIEQYLIKAFMHPEYVKAEARYRYMGYPVHVVITR